MTDEIAHTTTLGDLNRNYVRSVDEADVDWFDANLAEDFLKARANRSPLLRWGRTSRPLAKRRHSIDTGTE